jgi:LPS sulfotransferase NodH
LSLLSFPDEFRRLEGWRIATLDPRLDLPPAPLRKILVIASQARSGSNLLSEDLRVSGSAGVPREYLNPDFVYPEERTFEGSRITSPRSRRTWHAAQGVLNRADRKVSVPFGAVSARSVEDYLRGVARVRTTPNGVFSIKILADHFPRYIGRRREVSPSHLGVPVTWISLVRRDVLGQAISWVRAFQSKSWMKGVVSDGPRLSDVVEPPAPSYDRNAIATRIATIEEQATFWADYFDRHEIEPLVVTYEDYVADRRGGVDQVLDFAGLAASSFDLGTIPRQADEITEAWRERFLAESS